MGATEMNTVTVLVSSDLLETARLFRGDDAAMALQIAERIREEAETVALGVTTLLGAAIDAAAADLHMEVTIRETDETPDVVIELIPAHGSQKARAVARFADQLDLFH